MNHKDIAQLAQRYEKTDENLSTVLYALATARLTGFEEELLILIYNFIRRIDDTIRPPNREN